MGCNESKDSLKDKILEEHGKYQPTAANKAMCPYLNGLERKHAKARSDMPPNYINLLVRSATGLKDTDGMLSGDSDPYISIAVGDAGSHFHDKHESTHRISQTIGNKDGGEIAEFNWGVRINFHSEADEVQIGVMDKDFLSKDDFMGELRITIADLKAQTNNEIKTFSLSTQGTIDLMTGSRVQDAVLNHEVDSSDWGSVVAWSASLQAVFETDQMTGEAIYWKNQALFAIAGKSKDANGMLRFFTPRTTHDGSNDYVWKDGYFPQNCSVHTGYDDVVDKLKKFGSELGTNNGNGEVYRQNFLGNQRLTDFNWPELKEAGYFAGIGLCQEQEVHAWIRPILVAVVGPDGNWSEKYIRQQVRSFWKRGAVCKKDFSVFVFKLLHKVMFNIDMTDAEAIQFNSMQFFLLISNGLFEFAHKSATILKKLKWKMYLGQKAEWIAKYRIALLEMPQIKALSPAISDRQLTLCASMFMDAILYAGGAGLPTALGYAFAIPYTGWGHQHLPLGKRFKITKANYKPYMQECMRRFPPVGNFALTRRNLSGDGRPDQLEFLAVGRAHNDPREWGDKQFQIRPMKTYDEKSFPFLDFAGDSDIGSPNSHSCPGKALATSVMYNMLEAWIDTCGGNAVDINQWPREQVVKGKGTGNPLPANAKPLGMSEFGPDPFNLLRRTQIPASRFK